VLVSNVKPGSAADKAGIKRGDVITAINGEKIEDTNVLRNKVAGTMPGSEIKLTVVRGGSETELTATLDEFNVEDAARNNPQGDDSGPNSSGNGGKLGLSLQPLTPQVAKQLGVPADTEGLVVTDVDPSGPAADAGIARGDLLLEVNQKPAKSADDVRSALESAGDKPVLLLISRRGQTIYLTVRPQ
jgi:serine protease Do